MTIIRHKEEIEAVFEAVKKEEGGESKVAAVKDNVQPTVAGVKKSGRVKIGIASRQEPNADLKAKVRPNTKSKPKPKPKKSGLLIKHTTNSGEANYK